MPNDRVELEDEELQNIARENSPRKILGVVKLQIPGGNAALEPPLEPALRGYEIDASSLIDDFNERTKEFKELQVLIPIVITIYSDKTFDYIIKMPPAFPLLKKKANPDQRVYTEKRPIDKSDFDNLD